MFGKRFICIVMLTNVALPSDGRTMRDQNQNSASLSNRTKTFDPLFDSKEIEIERLKGTAISNDRCHENCDKRDPETSSRSDHLGTQCPYQSKELCLIFSLSKIAKVQVSTSDGASSSRKLKLNVSDEAWKSAKSSQIDGRTKEDKGTRFSESTGGGNVQGSSQRQIKLSNVRCQAVRDVYIPEVKHSLPAFACKSGNNTFVLSSARFLQDRRLHLDLKVNESIFDNVKLTKRVSKSENFNVIPALLILNMTNNNYRVELDGRNVNDTGKNG